MAGSTDFSRWDIAADPAKRIPIGRHANEGSWPSLAVVGRPMAFYTGRD